MNKLFNKVFPVNNKNCLNENWEICSYCKGEVTSYAAFIRGNKKKCEECVKLKDKEIIKKFEKYYKKFERGT